MTIFVPYHQDERLADDDIPLPASAAVDTIDPVLLEGQIWARLVTLFDTVADAVAARIRPHQMCGTLTVVSGDCLVTSATVTGVQRAGLDPSVVWFDAHGDVHTAHSSTSGYLGGMALRVVLGAHRERLASPLGLRPLTERQAVLVDARDLDPAEVDYLSRSELRRYGVEELRDSMLPDGPLVLHIDVDVISNDELPGMRFPAPNGPTFRAVLEAAGRVLATGRVIAVDIACPWNPGQDQHDTATRTRLLAEFLAIARNGN